MHFSFGITGSRVEYYQIRCALTANYLKLQNSSKFLMFIPSKSQEFFPHYRTKQIETGNEDERPLVLNLLCCVWGEVKSTTSVWSHRCFPDTLPTCRWAGSSLSG